MRDSNWQLIPPPQWRQNLFGGFTPVCSQYPARLYKFATAENAARLCDLGNIRLGTLYDFRKDENHSHGVLDEGEGLLHVEATSVDPDWLDPKQVAEFRKVQAGFVNKDANITITEFDHFVYCMSLSPSWDAEIDPSYTDCVEIFDVQGFIETLNDMANKTGLVERFDHGPVRYRGRDGKTDSAGFLNILMPRKIGLLKSPSYESQQEYRVLYVPKSRQVVAPLFLEDLRLAKGCSRYRVRP